MISKDKKLEALYNFGLMAMKNPYLSYMTGFLAGQVDRVHFVQDLRGAEAAVRLSVRRRALWPNEPFRATLAGVSMPNPLVFVQALSSKDPQICVVLDFDNAERSQWYQEVLLPNVSYVKDPEKATQEESSRLRREMDRILDIYRECKIASSNSTPSRQKEMEFYINLAEQQLKELSFQLETLNVKMKQLSES